MQYTFEEIINLLKQFQQDNSTDIKDFQFGNLSEITTRKSQNYKLLYVEADKAIAKENSMVINFNILIGDQENNSNSNRLQILSDCLSLQNKLIGFLRENDLADDYDIESNITLTPFSLRFNNLVTGWFMSLPITISRFNEQC